jgi:putative transposase
MIVETGNINLFPELDIPRTTALYWLRESARHKTVLISDIEKTYQRRINHMETQLNEERAKTQALAAIIASSVNLRELSSPNFRTKRKSIVKTIFSLRKILKLSVILKAIGMRKSMFHRWKLETIGCQKSGFRKFKIMSNRQLSHQEQRLIHEMATSKKYSCYSLKSLRLKAIRDGALHCSYDTWRRYLKLFGIDRTLPKKRHKEYAVGIRASKPNEIWHLDMTEIHLRNGQKYYLQLIVDNYSRFIIDWHLAARKNSEHSHHFLKRVFSKIKVDQLSLMTDKGTENTNRLVKKILIGKGVEHIIAQCDVQFSNSMIESFFKKLKSRFLRRKGYNTFKELARKIYRFTQVFNNDIPLEILGGRTPKEVFKSLITEQNQKELFDKEQLRHLSIRSTNNIQSQKLIAGCDFCFNET